MWYCSSIYNDIYQIIFTFSGSCVRLRLAIGHRGKDDTSSKYNRVSTRYHMIQF